MLPFCHKRGICSGASPRGVIASRALITPAPTPAPPGSSGTASDGGARVWERGVSGSRGVPGGSRSAARPNSTAAPTVTAPLKIALGVTGATSIIEDAFDDSDADISPKVFSCLSSIDCGKRREISAGSASGLTSDSRGVACGGPPVDTRRWENKRGGRILLISASSSLSSLSSSSSQSFPGLPTPCVKRRFSFETALSSASSISCFNTSCSIRCCCCFLSCCELDRSASKSLIKSDLSLSDWPGDSFSSSS